MPKGVPPKGASKTANRIGGKKGETAARETLGGRVRRKRPEFWIVQSTPEEFAHNHSQ